jgi:hypothetical protein
VRCVKFVKAVSVRERSLYERCPYTTILQSQILITLQRHGQKQSRRVVRLHVASSVPDRPGIVAPAPASTPLQKQHRLTSPGSTNVELCTTSRPSTCSPSQQQTYLRGAAVPFVADSVAQANKTPTMFRVCVGSFGC